MLDIAKAYGSIPHHLTFYALKHCGISTTWIDLLTSYYNGLWSKSFSTKAMSGWHKHSRGIFTEFKVSIILAEMNVILEFIMAGINSSLLSQFTVATFMDDFFLMLPSLSKTKDLLICISLALSYERISVKASKSSSTHFC